jgi:parvulin-like peptidyl-prolyl isomerase
LDATRQLGDRFRFLRNYEARNRSQVVNNFGEGFADELDQIEIDAAAWAGPFASRFGWHLVRLQDRTEPRVPPLDEIYAQVVNDYQYEIQIRGAQRAEDELMEKYEVAVELN